MIKNTTPKYQHLESYKSVVLNERPDEDHITINWSCNFAGDYDADCDMGVNQATALAMGEEVILLNGKMYLEDKVWIDSDSQEEDVFGYVIQMLEEYASSDEEFDFQELRDAIEPDVRISEIVIGGIHVYFGLDDFGYMVCMLEKRDWAVFGRLLSEWLNETA